MLSLLDQETADRRNINKLQDIMPKYLVAVYQHLAMCDLHEPTSIEPQTQKV